MRTNRDTSTHCFTASFDFAHFTFTSCLQTEKQAYLCLFHLSCTLQKSEEMSWSLILVLSNRKGIKMWHFSTLVTGKSAAALLLLWKWWALALFKCKFLFERSCAAVPLGALTVYCLFLSEYITNIALAYCTVRHQNNFHFKVIHIPIFLRAQLAAVAAVI